MKNNKDSDKDKNKEMTEEEKEKQIQEMLTPSFTIQELASAVFLIVIFFLLGSWFYESFFAPSEADLKMRELEERINNYRN